MKKKFFYVAVIFLFFFIFGWNSIGSKNTTIIKIKNIFPLEIRNNLKDTVFIIPKIIQENKHLNEKISQLNSSINAGLNFNDEVFSSIIDWYGIRKFYLPFNTSYFPNKKKSFIFKKENDIFIIFESGKIISFDESDFNKNKLFFKNYKSNLEYNFLNNERDNFSRILDVKTKENYLFISLLQRESENCYKLVITSVSLKNFTNLDFKEIYKNKKCLKKTENLIKNFGNINLIKNNLFIKHNEKLLKIDLKNFEVIPILDTNKDYEIFSNEEFLIKYFYQDNKFFINVLDLSKNTIDDLIDNHNFFHNKIKKNQMSEIFDFKKINDNKFKIFFLGKKMENIFIYEIVKKSNKLKLIDRIDIGKVPQKISDIKFIQNTEFLLTYEKEPSIGFLSTNVK